MRERKKRNLVIKMFNSKIPFTPLSILMHFSRKNTLFHQKRHL